MKIVFDTDGTVTDFNKFIKDNAYFYFKNEYGMDVVYPNKLEIEDILDMNNFFINKYNCTLDEAKEYTKKALNKFWVNFSRFIKFSLLGKFRDGTKEFINECLKKGHTVEIHTSRAKTTENTVIGDISRKFTYLQYRLNGINISYDSFFFYKNDKDKVEGILASKPDIAFDDKPEILSILNQNDIKTICINGKHNKDVKENEMLKKVDDFIGIDKVVDTLLKNKKYSISNRVYDSDKFYKKVRHIIPIILNEFKPIVLNKNNLINVDNQGIVVAPNHQSTLDPLIITSVIDENIHWAALKRFFDAEDSIFNNSKNPLLCKITSYSFKKFEYFPIERLRDTPHPNNIKSLKDMSLFLKNNQYVGIFPEGTTNKDKSKDFGVFESSFLSLARSNNAWVQPINVLCIKEYDVENKLILNFGKPFKVNNMTIDEALKIYLNIQQTSLEESRRFVNKLIDSKKYVKKI